MTKPFLIWLDNGRWNERDYLQADGTWKPGYNGMRTAALFEKREDAYAFERSCSDNIWGGRFISKSGYSKTHAGHQY